jgi:hypothetical protein
MRLVLRLILGLGLALLFCRRAGAVILYPEDDAAAGTIPRPAGDVVGQWSTNASCVAIRPNYVLTTRHQGGGVGTTVTFGGTQYVVAEEIPVGNADLRIARLTTPTGQPANLTDFVPVYNGNDNAVQVFTVGGFGRGRGAALTDPGNATYGYQWATGTNTNDTLRFGRNTIDGTDTVVPSQGQPFTSDVLRGDFDRRGPTAVPFEAMIAEFDSGSGWFVENGPGNWQVRGLSAYVGHDETVNKDEPANEALFASHLNASFDAPDGMEAIRLGSYADFINANVPEPTAFASLGFAAMLLLPRRRRRPVLCASAGSASADPTQVSLSVPSVFSVFSVPPLPATPRHEAWRSSHAQF